jgi:hypothetical protein
MARLFPQIDTPHRQVFRNMIWRQLFCYGEAGATPAGLAADLIKDGKAEGTVEECAALVVRLLEEIPPFAGMHRVRRVGERFIATTIGSP